MSSEQSTIQSDMLVGFTMLTLVGLLNAEVGFVFAINYMVSSKSKVGDLSRG